MGGGIKAMSPHNIFDKFTPMNNCTFYTAHLDFTTAQMVINCMHTNICPAPG